MDWISAAVVLDVATENLLHAVLETLAYADVFDYPLTVDEVYRYLGLTDTSREALALTLGEHAHFSKIGEYYTLRGREEIVTSRKRRAQVAQGIWPRALQYGRIIAVLPFVRMVAVTGSLAVDNTEASGDIDFMIVTAPNRLWSCRALSLLVARFARWEGIQLCPNYLVTTNALALDERSLYVAHELAQMIPLSGLDIYDEMRRLNDWTSAYLPNADAIPQSGRGIEPFRDYPVLRKILESVFQLPFFDWFERWEMHRKIARLSREQSSSVESYFSADVCKGHIDRHGENAVTALAVRLQKIS